jgi:hypothetical protein
VAQGELAVAAGGGTGGITVTAAAECAWTASAGANWISGLAPAAGQGNGEIKFEAAPNTGSTARQADISVNGATAKVTQAGATCRIDISPRRETVPVGGGAGIVAVTTLSGCSWSVTSNAPWLTASAGSTAAPGGTGPGTVTFAATANTGVARIGNLAIGDQTFVVTQQAVGGAQCNYGIKPGAVSVEFAGGPVAVAVSTGDSCSWTAASNVPWLTIGGSGAGSGNASITVNVAANTGAGRSGTVTIAEQTFTVTQAAAPAPQCTYTLQPSTQSMSATTGSTTVAVQTSSGCSWTATSNVAWLTIGGTGAGTGNGVVTVAASANTGASRTGTATIGGETFTVTQEGSCAASLNPTSASLPAAGGTGPSIAVTSPTGCVWTATTTDAWLTIDSGTTGSGNGTVTFTAAANSGAARTGTLAIAGQAFSVMQAGACISTILPTSQPAPAAGGTALPVAVTALPGCNWTASSTESWLTITNGASGTGIGTVEFTVASNTGPARAGTISIAGQAHTVNQAGGCSVSINPPSATPSSSGGAGTPIAVSAGAGCTWTATTATAWITVTSGTSGSGNGAVAYTVDANTGAAREGTIDIATNTFIISQAAACSYAINPTSQNFGPKPGTSKPIAVTAPTGCAWTATSNDAWITVENGATGSGNGKMTFSVSMNTDATSRVGTLTIAGETFTVTQDAGK